MGLADHLDAEERDALLEALFEHAPMVLQLFEPAGHPVISNPWMSRLMGRPPPPEYNLRQDEILARQGSLPLVERAFAGEIISVPPAWYHPAYLEHVDGQGTTRAAIRPTLVPLRGRAGEVRHVLVCCTDATAEMELRARDARQRLAFAAARMVAVDASIATRALQLSDGGAAILGVGEPPATLEALYALAHPDDRAAMRAAMEEGAGAEPVRVLRPDGAVMWIEVRTRVEVDDVSGQAWLHGILIDVTERISLRQAEDELRRAQKLEAIGRLAGGVAHDFNNMLTVILCYAGILARDGRARGFDHAIDAIQRSAAQAAALTRQLLAFSRQQVVMPSVFDLAEAVAQAARMLARVLAEDIELVVRGGCPAYVRADPGQIAQVVMNLVLNARDAMPSGGKLTLETERVVVDGASWVRLRVRDTGAGMDAETQRRMFEPFFTTKPHGRGTGLGLASVFGIVRQSGGTIQVQSEVGAGTSFEILWPCVVGDAPARVEGPAGVAPTGTETVLVVDDQALVRDAVREILETLGYHVLVAANAGEALLLCERHERAIHLLLSDVVMPHVSGPELARRVAPLRPDMRVLLMSGHTDGRPDVDAFPYIQKPLVAEELARRIRELLGTPGAGATAATRSDA